MAYKNCCSWMENQSLEIICCAQTCVQDLALSSSASFAELALDATKDQKIEAEDGAAYYLNAAGMS